jgi:hypothetical protein
MAFGPVGIAMYWYSSFSHPVNGVLPPPSGTRSGHFLVARGWRTVDGKVQVKLRNSWGLWGDQGDCWLPAEYLNLVWEAWKAVDQTLKPASGAVVTVKPFGTLRTVTVPGMRYTSGYDPNKPNWSKRGFWLWPSNCHSDAEVWVAWPGYDPAPIPRGGPFVRIVDGYYGITATQPNGLLLVEAQIKLT